MSSSEKTKKQSSKAKTTAKKTSTAVKKAASPKKTAVKKAPAKKTAAAKTTTAKKAAPKKASAASKKTTTAKKATPKKAPVKSAASSTKKAPVKSAASATKKASTTGASVAARSQNAEQGCEVMSCLCGMYQGMVAFAHKYLDPLLRFVIRLFMANIFFTSGILKLPAGFLGIGQGDWSTTLALFKYEHPVPYLDPEVAAYLGTTLEVVAPILLVFGFGGRIAAFLLLGMTAIAEFTYQHSMEHAYWALLLSVILFQGAGRLSVDYVIKKRHMGGASLCMAHK